MPAVPNENYLALKGPLNFSTVNTLYKKGLAIMKDHEILIIDCSAVTQSNSAALALFIEWKRNAMQFGKKIKIQNIPEQLIAIAKVSGLANMFITDEDIKR